MSLNDDESAPLLGVQNETRNQVDVDWVWERDAQNPLNWSSRAKWGHVAIVSVLSFLVQVYQHKEHPSHAIQSNTDTDHNSCTISRPLGATMVAPAVPQITRELHVPSSDAVTGPLVLSIYILGWAVGPLVFAPLSEVYGRLVVYTWSNTGYVLLTLACSWSPSAGTLIALRFLAGALGSTPLVIGGGTISDLVPVEQRGIALSLYMFGGIIGPSVGPVMGGLLSDSLGWRQIFRVLAGMVSSRLFLELPVLLTRFQYACATLAQIALMKETYAPVVRKSLQSGNQTGSDRATLGDDTSTASNKTLLAGAITRPAKLLASCPINTFIALVSAFFNGALFLVLSTLPAVLQKEYGFGLTAVGLGFQGLGIGNVVGLAVFASTSDRHVRRQMARGVLEPEDRLVPLLAAAPMLAVGFLVYGWSAEGGAHWAVPVAATGLIGAGNVLFFSAAVGYLVDAFSGCAASAVAANIVVRSIGGTLLPLAGERMYRSLGWGFGSTVLAGTALVVAPGLVLLYTRGGTVRARYPVKL